MNAKQLETPALTIDLDVMEQNLRRMAEYCAQHDLRLRPHAKTHKSPWLAKKQLEYGAGGITVAKLGEAEVMAAAGLDDMLLAYPIFGETKAQRLAAVANQACMTVSLDSEDAARWVSRAAQTDSIGVLVEIDLGMGRCGLPPGDEPVRLARAVEALPGIYFEGILFYPGHVHPDLEGNRRKLDELNQRLALQLERFDREKIPLSTVSGGSTPSAFHSHHLDRVNEIRPGTYIFNDRNTVEWGACTPEQCAASVLATVVSTAVAGQAVIDAGSKTFSSDPLAPGTKSGFGIVKEYPQVDLFRMNEEHGYLKLPESVQLKLGQTLEIIPNHACTTMNMHDRAWGVRQGKVVKEWEIAARGKLR